MNLNDEIRKYANIVENDLKKRLSFQDSFQNIIYESMNYSIFAGGKRIRPILTLKAFELIGGRSFDDALPFASAIEMIHTYSLIHDDLPAMDDDDFRRGKPTNHRKYGESIAILAGDALLNLAYETMINSIPSDSEDVPRFINSIKEVSKSAGVEGMIGGQVVDIISDGKNMNEDKLKFIHQKKTSDLIESSIVSGAILAGGDMNAIESLRKYGRAIGLCFQIRDDILDEIGDGNKMGKNIGSDQCNNKLTYITLYGLEKSIEKTHELYEEALSSLKIFHEKDTLFFRQFAKYLVHREN